MALPLKAMEYFPTALRHGNGRGASSPMPTDATWPVNVRGYWKTTGHCCQRAAIWNMP